MHGTSHWNPQSYNAVHNALLCPAMHWKGLKTHINHTGHMTCSFNTNLQQLHRKSCTRVSWVLIFQVQVHATALVPYNIWHLTLCSYNCYSRVSCYTDQWGHARQYPLCLAYIYIVTQGSVTILISETNARQYSLCLVHINITLTHRTLQGDVNCDHLW